MIFFHLNEFFFSPLLACLDIGAGVEQPFGCLIVQNRQAVQSAGRLMDWTIGGQHGRRFVLCHTHRLQRRPYPICTGRSGNVRHWCVGGWAGPRLFFLGRVIPGTLYRCLELKCGVLWGCPSTPRSIDDPATAPHVCCCCQKNWWVVVRWVQMGVSIEASDNQVTQFSCYHQLSQDFAFLTYTGIAENQRKNMPCMISWCIKEFITSKRQNVPVFVKFTSSSNLS